MKKYVTGALVMGVLFSACEKEPGVGGKAEIRGHVYTVEYDDFTEQPTGVAYYTPEHRVYIVYGDNDHFDDDTRTGPDGEFRFSWLRKGSYRVFTYSECHPDSCDSGVKEVRFSVEIEDRKEVRELPDLVIENW
ncbi:MAG: hypothetical protein KDB88_07520 [Flavobacteriales bacterium]|nr:hypothetical protein [Flavobacteriales bacterium]